jgi:hypothetical protein
MHDTIALIFGLLVLLTAVGLAGWEIYSHRKDREDYRWLHTDSRLRRRITMAILLLFVGALIVGESLGFLALGNLRHLLVYVSALTALAFALLILSVRDLGEMARNAERRAIEDLKKAIDEQRQGATPPRDNQ